MIKNVIKSCPERIFFCVCFVFSLFVLADTLYGPLHTKEAVKMFLDAVEQAKQQGGSVVCGGKVTYFYSPCCS